MKQYLIVFLVTIAIGQDTLITNAGVIYSGKIINSTPNYVEFFPKGWQYSTKLSTEKIKQLIDNSDQVKTEKDEKNSQQQTYSIANSPIVGRQSDKMYEYGLKPDKTIGTQKIGSLCITVGGLLLTSTYQKIDHDDPDELKEYIENYDSLRLRGQLAGVLIALGGLLQTIH